MSEIKEFTYQTYIWKQNEECSGFKISDKDCEYRSSEIEIVSYLPEVCEKENFENCQYLISYARFEN